MIVVGTQNSDVNGEDLFDDFDPLHAPAHPAVHPERRNKPVGSCSKYFNQLLRQQRIRSRNPVGAALTKQ